MNGTSNKITKANVTEPMTISGPKLQPYASKLYDVLKEW